MPSRSGSPPFIYNPRVTETAGRVGLGSAATFGAAAGAAALIVVMILASTWTGSQPVSGPGNLALTLAGSLPLALLWLAAAVGLGWPIRAWLSRGAGDPASRLSIQAGLGVAAMLFLDAALGAIGVLQIFHGFATWLITTIGIALLLAQIFMARRRRGGETSADRLRINPTALLWLAAPSAAVLLVAACSAPGWLWSSEFGGFDALSYHLQLPKEWQALGRIAPLEHNVYSFLPGYVEAAYYHLAILRGDAIESAYAAQVLHAMMAILTALITGQSANEFLRGDDDTAESNRSTRFTAGAIALLGTPWVIVVGSLAYNEMFVAFFFACGILAALMKWENIRAPARGAIMIGIFAAAAVGAKLTAIGLVAAPLALLLLLNLPRRRWLVVAAAAALAGAVIVSPYLIRNAITAGNPVFPLATEWLGTAHWSAGQAQDFRAGHLADVPFVERLAELWHQVMRFGIGPTPYRSGEPWKAQWSILFWLAAAGLIAGLLSPRHRRISVRLGLMLLVAIVFWLFFTHLKSRFLLPAAVPASLCAAIGIDIVHRALADRLRRGVWWFALLIVFACAWSLQPLFLFRSEAGGAPAARIGMLDLITGDLHFQALRRAQTPEEESEILETAPASLWISHLLPAGSRTLFVGEATPFPYRGEYVYHTVWDRGPLSTAMDESDDPRQWFAFLRGREFTHLLINATMLDVWERAGWGDRRLRSDVVVPAADEHAELIRTFGPDGATRLYRVE